MNRKHIIATLICLMTLLIGAGTAISEVLIPLAAGESITLYSGQSVRVPSGTTIFTPDGSRVTVNGHHNTVHASNGTVVTVSLTATGPADNRVIAK